MEKVKIQKLPNEETDLFEYRITYGDKEWSGFYATDAESYYCDELSIEHEDTLTAFKKRIRIEIGKLTN